MSSSAPCHRWRFSIRGMMAVTAGVALSFCIIRVGGRIEDQIHAARVMSGGIFFLGGTVGSFAAYARFKSDEAGAMGFLVGAVVGFFLSGSIIAVFIGT